MCFAGRMLVMATWHDHRILLLEAWTKFCDHPGWIGGENLYESNMIMRYNYSGWWWLEHEFYDFPFSWEWKIIPTDFHSIIFSEGRSTTNQYSYLPMVKTRVVFFPYYRWNLGWSWSRHPDGLVEPTKAVEFTSREISRLIKWRFRDEKINKWKINYRESCHVKLWSQIKNRLQLGMVWIPTPPKKNLVTWGWCKRHRVDYGCRENMRLWFLSHLQMGISYII